MRSPSHDRKGQGEWAEVCFLWRASALGFTVSRPFGDNARYDFVVDAGACLFRVQVKSVSVIDRNAYRIAASTGSRIKHGYTAADIDPLARGVGWLLSETGIPRRIKAAYLDEVSHAAKRLIDAGYVLPEDFERILAQSARCWELLASAPEAAAAQ